MPSSFSFEDDYASNGETGLANFAAALLAPEEAQGRGFAHTHKKVMGVPRTSEDKLRQLFAKEGAAVLEGLLRELQHGRAEQARP